MADRTTMRTLRPINRGSQEQRDQEMRAFWAEKIAQAANDRCPQWQQSREIRNIPRGDGLRNRPEVVASLRAMPYKEYLQTEWWRKVKKAAIRRAGYKCHKCGANEVLDVHHKTYERLGTEADDDLIALCRKCHEAEHNTNAQ